MTLHTRTMTCAGFLAAAIATTVLPYGLAAQDSEAAPCPREPTIPYEKGAIHDVTNEPPCRVVFRPTGVRLTGVGDGSRPDPGPLVVRDGRGRYYSANADGWESTISVWNADGSYLSSFGRAGEGPGEFKGWSLSLFVDDGDTLHVLDARDWMVFSPEYEFVRQAPSRTMEHQNIVDQTETFAPLYDGRILASNAHPSTGDAYFRIVDRDGSLDDVFGTSEEGTGASGHYGHDRAIGYLPGSRDFWAAPSLEGAAEYVLEEWDALGKVIVRSLRRHQPWFRWTGNTNSSPVVGSLKITPDRLLFVQLVRPTEEYAEAMERYDEIMKEGGSGWTPELGKEMDELSETLVRTVIEVIDVGSAQLLASASYPLGEVMRGDPLLPQRLFRNDMTGYVYQVGEDGVPTSRSSRGCSRRNRQKFREHRLARARLRLGRASRQMLV